MSNTALYSTYNGDLIENSFSQYIKEVNKHPFLTQEEEQKLVKRFIDHNDLKAAHKIVVAHLKLVVKIAFQFKSYSLPVADLISEGNIGLMKAVKKFKPSMKCRVATYAMWWIRASIQDYILRSWSMVKVSTSALKKKLFFNTEKAKKNIQMINHEQSSSHSNAALHNKQCKKHNNKKEQEQKQQSWNNNISNHNMNMDTSVDVETSSDYTYQQRDYSYDEEHNDIKNYSEDNEQKSNKNPHSHHHSLNTDTANNTEYEKFNANNTDYADDNANSSTNNTKFIVPNIVSLDQPVTYHRYGMDSSQQSELIDSIEDQTQSDYDSKLAENQITEIRIKALKKAMHQLNKREKEIILQRRIQEKSTTLETLSKLYGISKERVRQIENKAMEKLKLHCTKQIDGSVHKDI